MKLTLLWILICLTHLCYAKNALSDSVKFNSYRVTVDINENQVIFSFFPLNYIICQVDFDPDSLLLDDDNDGVYNTIDLEPNSDDWAAVDIHGVTLDSDHDGCPDHLDEEPYSSPVLPMENCVNVSIGCIWDVGVSGREYVEHAYTTWCLPYIFFDPAEAVIRPDAVPSLNQIADILIRYDKLTLRVVGYSDSTSDEGVNVKLSADRAGEVVNYLHSKGVPESRLIVVYKGETSDHIKNEKSVVEHQLYRRVELYFER
ncbi:MAG TPA: OmpA family protein [Chitinophagales bacterium]|nr:OmpA family protein [Chitinophagales bacterium]HNI53247.1 OmpA family protein [Chitinophagales bacterium]HNO27449.1 OmpA family protein [Chitinophagales bacterium]